MPLGVLPLLTLLSLLPLLCVSPGFGIPAARADQIPAATVDFVIGGDTVILDGGERVRLIGINAPELETEDAPAQPFAEEATRALARLVEKRRVDLLIGSEPRDRYGRTLAHLQLADGTDVQRELLRQGYALAVAVPPNLARLQEYARAETEARRAGLGIWGDPHFSLRRLVAGEPPDNGFQRITGEVTAIHRARGEIRIIVSDALTLLIDQRQWQAFWPGRKAESLLGRAIVARGWVWSPQSPQSLRAEKRMHIRHPFMLETEV